MKIADKNFTTDQIDSPLGVRGRHSDNALIKEKLDWALSKSLYDGLSKTYQ